MKRILIVDDQPDVLEVVRQLVDFACDGQCEITPSKSLQDGIDAITTCGPFDLAIFDFNIPSGTEGATLTRIMRDRFPQTPVIVMSGRLDGTIMDLCKADEYIAKPARLDEITDKVRRLTATVPAA